MKIGEKIRAIFARAQDEAIKIADAAMPDDKEKAKDEMGSGYDELVKMVKDLGEKVGAMVPAKPKDAATEPTESQPATVVAKDDDTGLEARLAKLEASVAKLLEAKAPVGDADGDDDEKTEDEDLVTDDDGDDDETKDEDMVSDKAYDSASRIEILAPGQKFTGKDARAKALKVAYATKDGKAVIEQFTGGKAPDFKSETFVDAIFVGASEVLKVKRASEFSRTKTKDFQPSVEPQGAKTAAEINEINAKHYASKK